MKLREKINVLLPEYNNYPVRVFMDSKKRHRIIAESVVLCRYIDIL